jgi:hypothetical protein
MTTEATGFLRPPQRVEVLPVHAHGPNRSVTTTVAEVKARWVRQARKPSMTARPCEGRVNISGTARGPRPGRPPASIPQRASGGGTTLARARPGARDGAGASAAAGVEAWRIGTQLSAAVSSSAWCLGDWLVYGQAAFSGRYRDALEQTSLDYQTLRSYAWVARRFPVSRRRDNLSFGHHAETAALPRPEQTSGSARQPTKAGHETSCARKLVPACENAAGVIVGADRRLCHASSEEKITPPAALAVARIGGKVFFHSQTFSRLLLGAADRRRYGLSWRCT